MNILEEGIRKMQRRAIIREFLINAILVLTIALLFVLLTIASRYYLSMP